MLVSSAYLLFKARDLAHSFVLLAFLLNGYKPCLPIGTVVGSVFSVTIVSDVVGFCVDGIALSEKLDI